MRTSEVIGLISSTAVTAAVGCSGYIGLTATSVITGVFTMPMVGYVAGQEGSRLLREKIARKVGVVVTEVLEQQGNTAVRGLGPERLRLVIADAVCNTLNQLDKREGASNFTKTSIDTVKAALLKVGIADLDGLITSAINDSVPCCGRTITKWVIGNLTPIIAKEILSSLAAEGVCTVAKGTVNVVGTTAIYAAKGTGLAIRGAVEIVRLPERVVDGIFAGPSFIAGLVKK